MIARLDKAGDGLAELLIVSLTMAPKGLGMVEILTQTTQTLPPLGERALCTVHSGGNGNGTLGRTPPGLDRNTRHPVGGRGMG